MGFKVDGPHENPNQAYIGQKRNKLLDFLQKLGIYFAPFSGLALLSSNAKSFTAGGERDV